MTLKKILVLLFITAGLIAAGCGGKGAKEKKGSLGDLKIELEKKKKEKITIETEIRQLEEKIAKADPGAGSRAQKLVAVDTVRLQDFAHYIELQGKVEAHDMVYVSPRGMPAQVRALYVKRGDMVRRGQLLAKLDDAVIQQQVAGLKVQRDYAQNLYNRQKNLWDQGIGTEVQLITAKNHVDGLNKQIAALNETWKTSFVYAPIPGMVNEVNIKVGEVFTGGGGMLPQIQIVNNNSLKIVTQVPENYISRVRKGMPVEVVIPESGRAPFTTVISMVGATIHPTNRSFITEAKLPSDPILKPNQTAIMKIRDYEAKAAISIPVNLVQSDEKGKYVYVAKKEGNKMVARKVSVNAGEVSGSIIEIKTGLAAGDLVITEGYQLVYDGQSIKTE